MLITALEITDYKRVRKVVITPPADRHLILIGGKNAQGKSSTLDALTAAFGGAKAIPSEAVRRGAEEASIFVELDGGKLTIDRVIRDGKSTLEVRDDEGAVRRPQEVLDKLYGARFLDPLAFLRLPAKEQRAQLMRQIPDAARIDELDSKRARAFDRRTEIGRDLTKAEGELARLPEVKPEQPIDVQALVVEQTAHGELSAALEKEKSSLGQAMTLYDVDFASKTAAERRLQRLEESLAQARADLEAESASCAKRYAEVEAAKARVEQAGRAVADIATRRAFVASELARAADHNRKVATDEATIARRADTAAAIEKLHADRDACTTAIATIDKRKAEILAAARLPVEGLAVEADHITLNGLPFAQASAAEQLRVAMGLASAASPGLQDVWVRDGSLLDDESLALLAELAAAQGKRFWIERVGNKDNGVIEIRDGEVAQ